MKKLLIGFVSFLLLVGLAACGRITSAPAESVPSLAELQQVCFETNPYRSQRDCSIAALMGLAQYTYRDSPTNQLSE
jgi:hypothetical protein